MIKFKKSDIPNIISVFRLILVPVFIVIHLYYRKTVISAGVFLLAGISDVIDGYLARKNNWISNTGKILDPLADKLMQAAVLVCLSIDGIISFYITGILICKELFLALGAMRILRKRNVVVQSKWFGKVAVTVFYIITILMMVVDNMSRTLITVLSIVLILVMVIAIILYYFKNYRQKKI